MTTATEEKLVVTAKKLWLEGKLDSPEGRQYLHKKKDLLGLNDDVLGPLQQRIDVLNEGLSILQDLSSDDEPSEFATAELREFCEIKGVESDEADILAAYRKRRPNTEGPTPASVSTAVVPVATPAPSGEPVRESIERDERMAEVVGNPQDSFWLLYKYSIEEILDDFSARLDGLGTVDELVKFDLPSKLKRVLAGAEDLLKSRLLEAGCFFNPMPTFQCNSEPLLKHARNLQANLLEATRGKRAVIEDYRSSLKGSRGRYYGSGSIGMVATAGAMNLVGGIFSGVSDWNKARNLAGEIDQQILGTIGPELSRFPGYLAEVLSEDYNVLQELGLRGFDEMAGRYADAVHILDHFGSVRGEDMKLDALAQYLKVFPYPEPQWLERLVELGAGVPQAALALLDAARSGYVGTPDDLEMARVLLGTASGGVEGLRPCCRRLCESGEFAFDPRLPLWPLNGMDVPPTPKLRLAAGLLSGGTEGLASEFSESLRVLERPLSSREKGAATAALLIEFFDALARKDWAETAGIAGRLVASCEDRASRKVLAALFLEKSVLQQGGSDLSGLWSDTAQRLGIGEEQLFDRWTGSGRELLLIASALAFCKGDLGEARTWASLFGTDPVPNLALRELPWVFRQRFDRAELVPVAQRTYLSFLELGIFESCPLTDHVLNVIYASLNNGCAAAAWHGALIDALQSGKSGDPSRMVHACDVLLENAAGKGAAVLLAMKASAELAGGQPQDIVTGTVQALVESGVALADLPDEVLSPEIRAAHGRIHETTVRHAREWCDAVNGLVVDAMLELMDEESPEENSLAMAQARAVCDRFLDLTSRELAFVSPRHLVGCWEDEKAFILVFTHGIAALNRGTRTYYVWPAVTLSKCDASGFINDYFKVEGHGSTTEVPVAIGSDERDNFHLLRDMANAIVDEWNRAYASSPLKWSALQTDEWNVLVSAAELKDHPAYFCKVADPDLRAAIHAAGDEHKRERKPEQSKSSKAGGKGESGTKTQAPVAEPDSAQSSRAWSLRVSSESQKYRGIRKGTFYTADDMDAEKLGEFLSNLGKKLSKDRCQHFAPGPASVQAFYDETVMGIGDRGIAVCIEGVAWTVDGHGFIPWDEIADCGIAGMLNKKVTLHLKAGGTVSFVLTQGNNAAEAIQKIVSVLAKEA